MMPHVLRDFINEVLSEDFESFSKEFKKPDAKRHLKFGAGASLLYDPTFETEEGQAVKPQARDLKRLWNQHVDRAFIQSLDTVHWIHFWTGRLSKNKARGVDEIVFNIKNRTKISGNDEMITSGYLPGQDLESPLGWLGIMLKGHVTFAANDQNFVYSGLYKGFSGTEAPKNVDKHQKTSGVPRRPTLGTGQPEDYILDRSTFKVADYHVNELIVDNWKPVAIVMDLRTLKSDLGTEYFTEEDYKTITKETGLPVIDWQRRRLI
jgi:hypothetical protein